MQDLIVRPRRLRTTAALRDLVAEARANGGPDNITVQIAHLAPGDNGDQ